MVKYYQTLDLQFIFHQNMQIIITNQNSKFFTNVIIEYDDKTITCDKLDLIISENML